MKNRTVRASLLVVEVLATLLAVGAAGAAFLYWRLQQGPISLSLLNKSAERSISRQMPAGYETQIDDIVLMRSPRGGYFIKLDKLEIRDADAREAASATSVRLEIDPLQIFRGKIGPTEMSVEGAHFAIVRNEQRRIKIPAAQRRERKRFLPALSRALDGAILRSAFRQAVMNDASVTFLDVASGRYWRSEDASVSITRTANGVAAKLNGQIDVEGAPASIQLDARYAAASGVVSVELLGDEFPVGDILTTFYGDDAAIIDAPVSGRAVLSLTSKGEVLASHFAARIDHGALLLAGKRQEISLIEWEANFDPEKNQFEIEKFSFDAGGSRGETTGVLGVSFGEDMRDPQAVSFDLTMQQVTINAPGFFEEPVAIDQAHIVGGYDAASVRLAIHKTTVALLGVEVSGEFSFTPGAVDENGRRQSPAVDMALSVDGTLDPQRLLRVWPIGPAKGARDWVADRLETAVVDNIEARVALPMGAVGEDGLMPDEALTVTFDLAGGKAYYVKQMTPLTHGAGSGLLRGNSFVLKVDRARIGNIAVSEGEIEFPEFIPKWQPTYIRFLAKGRSDVMLSLLDQEPLRLLSKIDLAPEQFRGDATARIEIMRPNKSDVPAEEYRYSGKASFSDMEISDLIGDIELTGAHGDIDLKARSMSIEADAQLSQSPIKIEWNQNFFESDGPSSFHVTGEIDGSTGDLFGMPARQFLFGPIKFEADALGEIGDFKSVDVSADFTNAGLNVDILGWRKPRGAPATGSIRVDIAPDEVEISSFNLTGEGVAASGSLAFDRSGALQRAQAPKLFFEGAADLSLTASRNESGELVLSAVGEYLNAGPAVKAFVDGGNSDEREPGHAWGAGIALTARIDRMTMRQDVEYRVASLDLWRDADRLQALDFSAFDHDGPPLTVNMALTGEEDGPSQVITAQTGEIGAFLRGVFGVTSVQGGEGVIRIYLRDPDEPGFSGELDAQNLKVVNAPLLARIFSAGSLDGLSNLLRGEGIDLTKAVGKFDYSDGVLSVRKMRATGPSLGITADGAFNMAEGGEVNLNGAVAPVYQINSFLGNAPIIGDILVGKKGEGVVALSYTVSGERNAPEVFINPLSALTPGIFRRLFDPLSAERQNGDGAETSDAPDDRAPLTESAPSEGE